MQGTKGGTGRPEDELLAMGVPTPFRQRGRVERPGAVVMGHGMYITGEIAWGDDPPFGMPVHVVTHHPRESLVKEGGTTFHFVTEGPERALKPAREAGGADLVQQFIRAGLLDELWLHIVPVFLGNGRRLFDGLPDQLVEWRKTQVLDSPEATHIRLRSAWRTSREWAA
ncbi:dihydrofolate reductase family protein [Streptomyces sp. NPDC002817]|uniref:dihydrofolate reductase family protein n=1 Tax=Streptomyces sp. NPDC088357 TaxID=3154655 RepID=UPI0034176108